MGVNIDSQIKVLTLIIMLRITIFSSRGLIREMLVLAVIVILT